MTFNNWDAFKAAAKDIFGLTAEMEKAQFFHLKPAAGEGSANFVLKVESQRKLN